MVTLKVANRSKPSTPLNTFHWLTIHLPVPKKPIKKLPTSIEITDKTTVQDVKEKLAKPGGWDPERFGIYNSSKKLLKDRKAIVSQQETVMSDREILIKDLGI
jgi:very-long-chain enoyl-CoA reductase